MPTTPGMAPTLRRWFIVLAIIIPLIIIVSKLEPLNPAREPAAVAQETAADINSHALAVCAAEQNSVRRLECYDRLAEEQGVARPTTATEQAGSWLVTTETSPIDDSTNVYVSVEAEGTIPNTFGFPVRPALVVRCKENTTSALINWKVFLDIEATPITYRNDNAPAEDSVWSVSTNHEAAGLWQGGEAIHFIRRLFGHHQLLARVTPYGANPVTATFSISGLEEAINPLREACHW